MKKKFLCLTLVLAMVFSFSIITFAEENKERIEDHGFVDFIKQDGFDTLTYRQEEYEVFKNVHITLEQNIEYIVKGFLVSNKAFVRRPDLYKMKNFISRNAMSNETVAYRLSETEYQRQLNEAMGWEITGDKISFSNYRFEISGDSATASVVEDYRYHITDGFDSESFRRREYTFKLERENNTWKITEIKTNDPWETDGSFVYKAINVKEEINRMLEENESVRNNIAVDFEDKKEFEAEIKSEASGIFRELMSWRYSVADAVSYAENHYDDTSNSVFGFTRDNNCQNFASQCVWAGLGGRGTSASDRPAVSNKMVESNSFNLWERGNGIKYYSEFQLNWSWDNVSGFANLIKKSTTSTEGPYGTTYYSNGIQNAKTGIVLSMTRGASPNRTNLSHAMFVTDVSGRYGSRTKSDVKIAAHTSPTNSAYMSVASYDYRAPISSFARSVIWRGHYSARRP